MATPKEAATKTDAEIEAERKAQEAATKEAAEAGAKATEEARKQDVETLKAQAEMRPYPSQEEADAMKSTAATGAAPYVTRQAKA